MTSREELNPLTNGARKTHTARKMNYQNFKVWHEKGGFILVSALDEKDAIEKYYEAIESMIGHHLGTCSCHENPKKFDRGSVLKIVRIEKV